MRVRALVNRADSMQHTSLGQRPLHMLQTFHPGPCVGGPVWCGGAAQQCWWPMPAGSYAVTIVCRIRSQNQKSL